MALITTVFATVVAAELFYIMFLETFATTSKRTAAAFQMDQRELGRYSVEALFRNQGVYNGLLGVLILLAVYLFQDFVWTGIFMVYLIFVSAYASLAGHPRIILLQGGLAVITLACCLIWH